MPNITKLSTLPGGPKPTISGLLRYTEHIIETHASGTFMKASAKCYRWGSSCGAVDAVADGSGPRTQSTTGDGTGSIVLMFAHGTGYHKEQWEPTLVHLFKRSSSNRNCSNPESAANAHTDTGNHLGTGIKEAWSVDCQHHGESAVLNERMVSDDPGRWSSWDYADAFATLRVQLEKDESYRNDKFVLVAHSASACAAVLATSFFPTPHLLSRAFHALVLVEPAICPPHLMADEHQTEVYHAIARMMPARRDVWASRDEARAWLARRVPWCLWDKDVLNTFVEHGLKEQTATKSVTLKTPKTIEILAYTRGMQQAIPAVWRLNQICSSSGKLTVEGNLPGSPREQTRIGSADQEEDLGLLGGLAGGVHLIWGAVDDMFSRETKDALEDPSQGRIFTSVTRMEAVGHLIVQQDPKGLADVLWTVLMKSFSTSRACSKPPRESKL